MCALQPAPSASASTPLCLQGPRLAPARGALARAWRSCGAWTRAGRGWQARPWDPASATQGVRHTGCRGASRPGLRRDRLMVRVSAGSGAQASAPAGAWPAWSRACRRWPRARRRPHRTPPPRPPRARGWTPAAPSCATRWPGCRRGGAPPTVWPQPVPAWQQAPVEALRLAWLCTPLGWKGRP